MAGHINVELVSADRSVWKGEAELVVARTTEGELGVMADHQPMLTVLIPGEIRIQGSNDGDFVATVGDGFFSVENNRILIVAEKVAVVDGAAASA